MTVPGGMSYPLVHSLSTSLVLRRYHFRPSHVVGTGVMGLRVGLAVGKGTIRGGTGFKVGLECKLSSTLESKS